MVDITAAADITADAIMGAATLPLVSRGWRRRRRDVYGHRLMAYSLPPNCAPYNAYYQCGNVWYQPQYQGSTVTYVVVNAPG